MAAAASAARQSTPSRRLTGNTMIRLKPTQKLQALLAGAVATTQPQSLVNFSDQGAGTYLGDSQRATLNGVTAADICAAPAADTIRDVDYLSIRNRDTASITLTVRYNDNGTPFDFITVTLATLETLVYVHGSGWSTLKADGSTKGSGGSGGGDAGTRVDSETPSGAANGVNATFTLANTPLVGTLRLYLNGIRQRVGVGNDYTLTGNAITYLTIPGSGETHVCDYRY